MSKEQTIKDNTPPTDDWEHYADRLYELAYKHGYDKAMRVVDDIKAEIPSLSHWQSDDGQDLAMVADVLECIDKHIGGKENET